MKLTGRTCLVALALALGAVLVTPGERPAFAGDGSEGKEKKKSVDAANVYFGDATKWEKPAEVDPDKVYAKIDEYKEIVSNGLKPGDAKYEILMCKASTRFTKAVKKTAKDAGYDLVARNGCVKGCDTPPPDVTTDTIANLSSSRAMRRAGLAIVPFVVAVAAAQDPPTPAAPRKPAVLVPELVGTDGIRKPDGRVVHYYRVNYVDPGVLMTELNKWCGPKDVAGSGTVEVMAPMYPQLPDLVGPFPQAVRLSTLRTLTPTTLRIEDVEEKWPVYERVLSMIDVPQLQVYVEAKIVEVLVTDELHFGVEAHLKRPLGDTFFQGSDVKFPNAIDAANFFTSKFRDVGKKYAFDYIVDLVDRGAKTKITSRPGVFASQGETATIRIGDNEPIVTQTLYGTTVTASTQFQPVGLRLEVQPILVGRSAVRARVSAESSRLSEFRVTATSTDLSVVNPVISTRNADTVVTVNDGDTLVIGGLDQTSDTERRTGIPLLMDIPVAGVLFGSTTKSKDRTELFFFLTFRVLTPTEARIVRPPSERDRAGE